MCLKLFPSIIFATFRCFLIVRLWPSSNDTNLSPFCHNLACCHHFVAILSQYTMRRRKLYIDDKLNRAIGEYCNGTKNFIAVNESMNVCLNSVEASFQMIIDACEFAVPALYQLFKNLVFLFKIAFFAFSYLPIGLKSRFQAQTG